MKYSAYEIKGWEKTTESFKRLDGFGQYVKVPERPKVKWNPAKRFYLAMCVFLGVYDVLDWEDA